MTSWWVAVIMPMFPQEHTTPLTREVSWAHQMSRLRLQLTAYIRPIIKATIGLCLTLPDRTWNPNILLETEKTKVPLPGTPRFGSHQSLMMKYKMLFLLIPADQKMLKICAWTEPQYMAAATQAVMLTAT